MAISTMNKILIKVLSLALNGEHFKPEKKIEN